MLLEQIEADFIKALKEKNAPVVSTLRMLKAAMKNKEIEKKAKSLTEPEIQELIQKQVKQRKDSIAEFQKGNRQDLVKKEEQELQILERYLPKALSEEELKTLVTSAIQTVGAKSKAELGKVMKEVMAKAAGRADGKRISEVASSLLG